MFTGYIGLNQVDHPITILGILKNFRISSSLDSDIGQELKVILNQSLDLFILSRSSRVAATGNFILYAKIKGKN